MSSAPLPSQPPPAALAPAVPLVRVSARLWLAGIVAVSFAVRLVAALAHEAPRYFPDEYIYSSLARSISQGALEIRGTAAGFPALLEPLLASPLWLVADTEGAYRLTQAMHALAVSLAAVPVYWLARRLGLPSWQASVRHAWTSVSCRSSATALPSPKALAPNT